MALKAKLNEDQFAKLSDDQKGLYVERDGSHVLDVEAVDGFDLQNVHGLVSALQNEREAVKKANEKLAGVGDLDPAAYKAAITELETLKKQGGEVGKEAAAQIAAIKTAHTEEVGKFQTREKSMMGNLETALIDSEVSSLLTEEELRGNAHLLLPHVRNQARIVENDGTYRSQVFDPATGQERLATSGPDAGKPLGLRGLLSEMKKSDAFSPAFAGTGATGSGSTNGQGGPQTGGHVISEEDARNPNAYRAAKAEAEKAGASLTITE